MHMFICEWVSGENKDGKHTLRYVSEVHVSIMIWTKVKTFSTFIDNTKTQFPKSSL